MKNLIRKIIREQISKLFELEQFETKSAEQLAQSMALYKFPRKGVDDMINNFNQVEFEREKTEEEKEQKLKDAARTPSINGPMATTLTNLYESEIEESYGIYGSTEAGKLNLDKTPIIQPINKKVSLGKETEEKVSEFNNNIDIEMNQIKYPGNTNGTKPPINI